MKPITVSVKLAVDFSDAVSRRNQAEVLRAFQTDPLFPTRTEQAALEKDDTMIIGGISKFLHVQTTMPVVVTLTIGAVALPVPVTTMLFITGAFDSAIIENVTVNTLANVKLLCN